MTPIAPRFFARDAGAQLLYRVAGGFAANGRGGGRWFDADKRCRPRVQYCELWRSGGRP